MTSGDSPKPRCDHGCCVADRKMFVFGGSAGDNLWLNDLSYLCLGEHAVTGMPEQASHMFYRYNGVGITGCIGL